MSKKVRQVGLFAALLCLLPCLDVSGDEPVSSRRIKRPILVVDEGSSSTGQEAAPTAPTSDKNEPAVQIRSFGVDRNLEAVDGVDEIRTTPTLARRNSAAQRLRSAKNSMVYRDLSKKDTDLELTSEQSGSQQSRIESTIAAPKNSSNSPFDFRATTELSTDLIEQSIDDLEIPGDETITPLALNTHDQIIVSEHENGIEGSRFSVVDALQETSDQGTDDFADTNERDSWDGASEDQRFDIPRDDSDSSQEGSTTAQDSRGSESRMRLSPIEESDDSVAQLRNRPIANQPQNDSHASGDVLFETQNPVISVRTRGPRTIVVGKTARYTIDLINASENPAKDVVISVRIPSWTELKDRRTSVGVARIQPDDQGNTIMQWSIGNLGGNEKQKLLLDIIPRSSRPFDLDVSSTFNPARSLAQIQVKEPKLELSVAGPSDIPYGATKVYSITVSNPGTGDAENVVLQLMPLVPTDDNIGVREIGVVKAGTHEVIEVELTAKQTGRLQVRAEVTGDGGLASRSHQDVIVRRAALEVQVTAPQMKYAGTKAQFLITVTNNGDEMAQDVVAVATLPSGIQSIVANGNATIHETHGQVQWEIGSLQPGAARQMEVEGVLTKGGTNRIDLRTVAAGNLSAVKSASTLVESLADLKLVVNDPKGAIAVASDVVYEVRIMNRGTKEAKNISVVGYFSEGIEPSEVSGWAGRVGEGQVDLDLIKQLGPGQEMIVKITAQAKTQGNHVFRAELMCNNPETRLASEEWTRFYGDSSSTRQAERTRTRGTSRPLQRAK